MTTTTASPEAPHDPFADPGSLRGRSLPERSGLAAVVLGVVLVALLWLVLGWPASGSVVVGWILAGAALAVASFVVEGKRKGIDRTAMVLVTTTFGIAMVPLVSILATVVKNGGPALSAEFLTSNMEGVVGEGGGVYAAIVGTVLITLGATVISVPIGLFTSIYLVEYADGSRMASAIRFLVDVMTGIPSIVAGLFAYAFFSSFLGPGIRFGLGGSVALSILMIPVVVRSTEEMLKLVPNELREASYALGVPKWRTISKVVLPTALAGIGTGVTLAIARVIGETAPLLLIAGYTFGTNYNIFSDRMPTLSVYAYSQALQPGAFPEFSIERAWGAALVLMIIVMLLNLVARLISYFFSPKGES